MVRYTVAAVVIITIVQTKSVVVTRLDIIVDMVVEGSHEPMNHEGDTTSQNFFVYGVVLATKEQSGMFSMLVIVDCFSLFCLFFCISKTWLEIVMYVLMESCTQVKVLTEILGM